ncbi:MAG: AzlC family ABC transporter permease [Anaerolineales bacterium]|jgi:4-azaleucine resistance transporter AzlC
MQTNHIDTQINTPQSEFFSGVKAEIPLLIGVIPFGMIYGILAIAAGLPPSAAQAMSFIIFAGSSQFVSAQLYGLNVPGIINVFTVGVINLRHALYSASMAPYLQKLPIRWKLFLAYLLTDEAYAVSIVHYQEDSDQRYKYWFFFGAGLTLWTTWQLSTAAGIFLGTSIPTSWSLDFTLALIFIAIVIPSIKDKASLAAALAAGVAAVILFNFPLKTGLLLASLVGITVGMVIEARS